jgi:CRISPR-associated exonuclease Cas4
MAFTDDDEPISISALQHVSYCPRQYALIHLEQEFIDNVHTQRGQAAHQRVDTPGVQLERGVRMLRGLPLFSRQYNLIGKADLVEQHADGRLFPVEYKFGAHRGKKHDHVQLTAQAVCLEEMTGQPVRSGAIYHVSQHRRQELAIGDTQLQQLQAAIAMVNDIRRTGHLPPPVNDSRCTHCSLKPLCEPEAVSATHKLSSLQQTLYNPEDATV